jgi:putative methyltransferase
MVNFYDVAAKILDKVLKKQGTIKSLVMSEKGTDKKLLYALVCESLKYRQVIEEIMDTTQIAKQEKKMPRILLMVLIYDLLFGKGIRQGGEYKKQIMRHKSRLHSELVKIKVKRKCNSNQDLIPEHIQNAIVIPRYVRVNTLKVTFLEAVAHFQRKGYKLLEEDYSKAVMFPKRSMFVDPHIPNLLVLPPNSDLHKDELLINGAIILQDKASCFPAFVLNPPKGSTIIDGCAAPGNKTSHLSMILENSGKIFAFDMDKRRLDTLKTLTSKAGCLNIEPTLGSFLETNPKDDKFSQVEFILLDPSCSGSGIVGRLDHLVQDEEELNEETPMERVLSLAEFQKQCLLHAFKFPKVKKVVYSTCSKHKEENEQVVEAVLRKNKSFRLAKNPFPEWKRRGEAWFAESTFQANLGDHVIRTDPKEDKTIGFFVALFERQ